MFQLPIGRELYMAVGQDLRHEEVVVRGESDALVCESESNQL